jgi:hypothetical protein
MAKSELRKLIDSNQALPSDCVLGFIVFYTINDGEYLLADIAQKCDDLGLNSKFLPKASTEIQAFKLACTEAERVSKPYAIGDDQVGEIMAIREVVNNSEMMVQHIVREVRDNKHRKLRHETVGELKLYRPVASGHNGRIIRGSHRLRSGIFDDGRLQPGEIVEIKKVIDQWETEFDRLYQYINGTRLRYLPREYVKYLNGVAMKSSVYFVHQTREDELMRLKTLIDGLGNGCSFEVMPIPELKRLRESVVEAFQREAVEELTGVVKAISLLRGNRKNITPDAYSKLRTQYEAVMKKANEYTRTLRCSQDQTAGAAEIALESLNGLRMEMVDSA